MLPTVGPMLARFERDPKSKAATRAVVSEVGGPLSFELLPEYDGDGYMASCLILPN